ncbi:MAG: universal stress protein, partial [Desulfurobacteriaceae bacterium]
MLFEKVLYPVDLEKASLNAKPYILKLKEAGCSEVHLLYVLIPSEWGFIPRANYTSEEMIESLKASISEGFVDGLKRRFKKLQELAGEFEREGIKTTVSIIPGELNEVISSYAEENDIKLVVLGISAESLSFFKVGEILD